MRMLKRRSVLAALPVFVILALRPTALLHAAQGGTADAGDLVALDSGGQPRAACPLKHTDVKADISGFLARITVTQEFRNPFDSKIEAVYTFPLPPNAAVDDMTMLVGDRTIRGTIRRREEARAVYEAARSAGHVAGLLDQERPNIFTQSVANIAPNTEVKITISYVETLQYEAGTYEFRFPMVVGPRYIPGCPVGKQGGGWAPDTDRVPDASRITPPVTPPGTRAGHDISLRVALDTGVPITQLRSGTHDVSIDRPSSHRAIVRLRDSAVIPNKDFVLKYDVAGPKIADALLTHHDARGGFFTLILQPPERVEAAQVAPKELVFVLDTSGSMNGFPIEKAKEAMRAGLDGLYPQDTFNLITFSGDTAILFPQPVPATPDNIRKAQEFLAGRRGSGGTEMMKAIRAALDPSDSSDHVRIVCLMTDGYVGNDMEIIAEVQKHPNARVFAFGIGTSVNHFLLDNVAKYGRGEAEYVNLNDDGSAAARRFHERVRNPLLTDIEIDWGGLHVADVYPRRIPDLFADKPVIVTGRYTAPGPGTMRLRGRIGGRTFLRELNVDLPASDPAHDVLAPLWARTQIEELMGQDYGGAQRGAMRADLREAITGLGLDYRLMTQFTSFVAVEEMVTTEGGQPHRVEVPVEMPEGVSYEGVFGNGINAAAKQARVYRPRQRVSASQSGPALTASIPNASNQGYNASGIPAPPGSLAARLAPAAPVLMSAPSQSASVGVGSGSGIGAGRGGGVIGSTVSASAPPPPPVAATVEATSAAPLLQTETSTVGSVMESHQVSQLPLATRNYDQLKLLTPGDAESNALLSKLHPALVAIVERLKNPGAKPSSEEAKFVRQGQVKIQIWLISASPQALERLKQLGFKTLPAAQSGNSVVGEISIEKLSSLAALDIVRYAEPFGRP
ncbi:MAG: VIT domain-containing protein [Bryobacteraceae bacterium]